MLSANADSGNNFVTSITLSLSGNLVAGNLLVVAVATFDTPTITDTLTPQSTFTLAAGISGASIYYATLASSAASDTVTVSIPTATTFLVGSAYEVSGVSAGAAAATGTGPDPCNTSCTAYFSTSSTVSYASGAFLVGAVLDTGEPGSFTPTTSFNSYQYPPGAGLTEWQVAGSSGSTTFSGSDSLGGAGAWYEVGAAFPVKGLAPSPAPIPPAAAPVVLHLTTYGNVPLTGHRVGMTDTKEVIYNIPSINQSLLDQELLQGNFTLFPETVSACTTQVQGQTYIRLSGFYEAWWGGSLNSTEFAFGGYASFTVAAQGWPAEPACTS